MVKELLHSYFIIAVHQKVARTSVVRELTASYSTTQSVQRAFDHYTFFQGPT